jgi:D-arginine dehydrogenase
MQSRSNGIAQEPAQRQPAAMDLHNFDAIVIGAGIAGATAAAHLAPSRRVALLEAEDSAGYHTTGRSAAIWILNYGPPDVRALSGASRVFFEAPPEGFPPLARARAIVNIAPPEQAAKLAAMLAGGIGMEAISVAEVAAMVPPLRPGFAAAATIERDAFDIDVAALHQGFLRVAQSLGGTLALRSRAGRIWRADGLWHAETSTGDVFAAPILVNAAGAWGDEVATLAEVAPIGLQPKRRTALIIDPGPYDCADWPLLGDAADSWYLRPEARRKLMLSPADETDSPACDARPEEIDIAIAIDRMQQALDIPVNRVEHSWAGLRTFTPDGSLAIGEGGAPGFYWMCGQGGYGMQTAPAAGALLAHIVDGTDPGALASILAAVNPRRFEAA